MLLSRLPWIAASNGSIVLIKLITCRWDLHPAHSRQLSHGFHQSHGFHLRENGEKKQRPTSCFWSQVLVLGHKRKIRHEARGTGTIDVFKTAVVTFNGGIDRSSLLRSSRPVCVIATPVGFIATPIGFIATPVGVVDDPHWQYTPRRTSSQGEPFTDICPTASHPFPRPRQRWLTPLSQRQRSNRRMTTWSVRLVPQQHIRRS